MPAPARRLAEYFASIVVEATSNLAGEPAVRCRRRPARRPCAGVLMAYPSPEEPAAIEWYCPVCGDHGVISGWVGTLWDGDADDESRVVS